MLRRTMEFLRLATPPKSEAITLLVIGPPSCGKTALIYFLLRFASMKLRPANATNDDWYPYPEQEKKEAARPVTTLDGGQGGILAAANTGIAQSLERIRVIGWPAFTKMIREETINGKNISSTEKTQIDLIRFRSSILELDIYNIAGEVFRPTSGDFSLVEALGDDLEGKDPDKIFTLLCNESNSVNAGVDIGAVLSILDQSQTARRVWDKMAVGHNTLRVVTKFDLIHEIKHRPRDVSEQKPEYYFQLIQEPLSKLYSPDGVDYIANHLASYQDIEDHTFKGSNGKMYRKNLICTGMYDRVNYRNKIYVDQNDGMNTVSVLNECFRGDSLKDLSMFGIKEIFTVILGKSRVFENKEILKFPSGNNMASPGSITNMDYRKILDNQIPRIK